jgi:hypothetical protein
MPSTVREFLDCQFLTAASVSGPKYPFTVSAAEFFLLSMHRRSTTADWYTVLRWRSGRLEHAWRLSHFGRVGVLTVGVLDRLAVLDKGATEETASVFGCTSPAT